MCAHGGLHELNRVRGHETQVQLDDIFRYRECEFAPPSHEKLQEASAKLADEQLSTTSRGKVAAAMF
jgi:hypothetical protein